MDERMRDRVAPGQCVDCAGDAYIWLARTDGAHQMVCAHCFAERVRGPGHVPVGDEPRVSDEGAARSH